jgi:hypothetical protein
VIEYFESGNFCQHKEEGELILAIKLRHRQDAYDSLVGHLESITEPDHPNRDIQVITPINSRARRERLRPRPERLLIPFSYEDEVVMIHNRLVLTLYREIVSY